MKRYIIILLCLIGIHVYAVDYVPYVAASTTPVATMQSVNSTSFMSSGSKYSSNVHEVDSSTPSVYPMHRARRGAPGTDGTGYDPNNPQFAPIGDAVLPLLALAILYAAFLFLHFRRRQACRISQAE